jgi:RNA polymerase sigma factor (sigma-70 family)
MGSDVSPHAPADLSGENDADLMAYMGMASDDPAGARDAWAEFYRRHAGYLYAVCMRAFASLLGGEPGVCDLVADTFKRAYDHAAGFDAEGIRDRDQLRRRARAWLGRIAQRLVQDILRRQARLETTHLEPDEWQQVPEPPAAAEPNADRIDLVREALSQLSEKEQIVIRTTFQWYQPSRANQRLPNDVAADLAETLGTTPENLRQIRRRALAKIRAFLEGRGLFQSDQEVHR